MRILLAVTGGIAAYKAVELVRVLQQAGHEVAVLQTPASQQFVGAATFTALTGRPVVTSEWHASDDSGDSSAATTHASTSGSFPHLDLGRWADVLVVAPATANMIARLAAGIADDVVSSTYLGFGGPVVVAPAMNVRMWNHAATRRNLAQLVDDGVAVVQPEDGLLACGDVGAGRLAAVDRIAAVAMQLGSSAGRVEGDLSGMTLLVTAGGTREPLDDVRFIGNRSSGRMGVAVARAAARRGATVRLVVTDSVDQSLLGELEPVARVERAAELQAAVEAHVAGCDAVVMAAAVGDFTVDRVDGKLERGAARTVHLVPTVDILGALGDRRAASSTPHRPTLVGFAAESGGAFLAHAREKLERKRVDAIVCNDVSRSDIGFDATHNEVTIVTASGDVHVARAPKEQVADRILDELVRVRV